MCRPVIDICSVNMSDQDNILITQYISKPITATEISITVDFDPGNCSTNTPGDSLPMCRSDFILHILYSDNEITNVVDNLSSSNVVQNPVVSGDGVSIMAPMQAGFYMAFRDMGACVTITRVRVIYASCKLASNNFAEYDQGDSGELVTGMCFNNSIVAGNSSLSALCTLDASYNFSTAGSCECNAGYEPKNNQCTGEIFIEHMLEQSVFAYVSLEIINFNSF